MPRRFFCLVLLFAFVPGLRAAVQRTSIGPEGGGVTALAVDPGSAATVYAGTGNGIYKSVDRGQSWTEASRGLTNVAVAALVIDPAEPRTLLAGTAGGLFRSTDGAGTWQSVPLTAGESFDVQSLALDEADPRTLYAGIDPRSPADHLVRSTDGGASWEVVPFPGERPLALAASGPLVLAGTAGGLYRSTDGGASWSAVAAVPGTVRTLFLRRLLVLAGTAGGIFRSLDGGATWASAGQGIPNPQTAQTAALAADPVHPWVFYAGISRSVGGGVYKSADRGGHWRPVSGNSAGLAQRGVLALAVDPATPATVYAGTQVDGVFCSLDAAASWRVARHGLRAATVFSVAVDPSRPRRLYAVAVNGIFRSGDGGATWTRLRSDPSGDIAVDATGVVYALTGTLGLARSRDAGVTWTSIDPDLQGEAAFALDPAHPAVLFAGGHWTLARSRRAGAAWSNEDMKCMDVQSLDVVARTGEVYAAGFAACQFFGGGVRRSLDGGTTWVDVSTNLPSPLFVQTFAADPRTPAHLFAGLWPSGGAPRGAGFRSTDHGASWSRLNGPGGGAIGIGAFAFPPDSRSTVYAGADGVWVSPDGGATWSRLDPLAGRLVNGLALDPTAPGTLFAAAEGGLFQISAD